MSKNGSSAVLSSLTAAQQFLVVSAAGFVSSAAFWYVQKRLSPTVSMNLGDIVDPEAVEDIAAMMPENIDDFTLEAWDFVGKEVNYSLYGSHLHFEGKSLACTKCLTPEGVLQAGRANCVGKAALLTSILRNKYAEDKAYMVVGDYNMDGIGGHAWVVVERNGSSYVLESTMPPPEQPWMKETNVSDIYIPDIYFNDSGMVCYDPEVCMPVDVVVDSKPCYMANPYKLYARS